MAINNAKNNKIGNYHYNQSSAENIVELINRNDILFLDPPRVGLHDKVVKAINKSKPPYIFYLSCNPLTQQANIDILKKNYEILELKGYNFYPKTPHLESLILLRRKKLIVDSED